MSKHSDRIKQSFEDFYKSILPTLKELEKKRLEASFKLTIWALAVAVMTGLLVTATYLGQPADGPKESAGTYFVLWLVIFLIAVSAIFYFCFKDFKEAYYEQVIRPMVKWLGNELDYDPSKCIPEKDFNRSQLFEERVDRYRGSHLVSGKIGKTEIRLSFVHAEEEHTDEETDSDGRRHTRTHYVTIFKGIFIIADFNKEFKTEVLCLPSSRPWKQKIILEDPHFHRYFRVYGEDQIEARYVLSTSLMRRILDLRLSYGKDIYISFVPPYIYIALPDDDDKLFEPSCSSNLLEDRRLEIYFRKLAFATGIVEALDLNTRIWGKKALA